jgi:hypothetical protein
LAVRSACRRALRRRLIAGLPAEASRSGCLRLVQLFKDVAQACFEPERVACRDCRKPLVRRTVR